MAKLTAKQEAFAVEYMKCLNATEAAKKAGYSQKTAYSIGNRLLKNVEVKNYMGELKSQVMDDNILTLKETMTLISSMAKGERKEQKEMILKKPKFIIHPETNKKILVYEEEAHVQELEPKNSDVLKAMELMGRHHAAFTDNQMIAEFQHVTIVDDI